MSVWWVMSRDSMGPSLLESIINDIHDALATIITPKISTQTVLVALIFELREAKNSTPATNKLHPPIAHPSRYPQAERLWHKLWNSNTFERTPDQTERQTYQRVNYLLTTTINLSHTRSKKYLCHLEILNPDVTTKYPFTCGIELYLPIITTTMEPKASRQQQQQQQQLLQWNNKTNTISSVQK